VPLFALFESPLSPANAIVLVSNTAPTAAAMFFVMSALRSEFSADRMPLILPIFLG
jgi:hypothetical protein